MKWKILYDDKNIKGKAKISPRASTSLVFYNDCLWIFGGNNANNTFNDFWKFDLNKS